MTQPQSVEAEEAVLGSMILSRTACQSALETLEPDGHARFFRPSHATIYATCRGMFTAGMGIDSLTLIAQLDHAGKLETIGGKARIAELAALTTSTANVAHHAKIVRETDVMRRFVSLAGEWQRVGGSATDMVEKAERELAELRAHMSDQRNAQQSMDKALAQLGSEFGAERNNAPGIPFGITGVPNFQAGRVHTHAGYTAHGKTIGALTAAKTCAQWKKRCGFFSLEMPSVDLAGRFAAGYGVSHTSIEKRYLYTPQRDLYANIMASPEAKLIDIVDLPSCNVSDISRYQRANKWDLLVIDHLHQMERSNDRDYRISLEKDVREIARIAGKEQVPILLLAQLSRSGQSANPFPRPSLSSLRDTAVIEQVSWVVSFIWRKPDENHLPLDDAEFITSKNRSGRTGVKSLRFVPDEVRFEEVA